MSKRKKIIKRILIALLVLVLLVLALVGVAFAYYWHKLDLIQFDDGIVENDESLVFEDVTEENGEEVTDAADESEDPTGEETTSKAKTEKDTNDNDPLGTDEEVEKNKGTKEDVTMADGDVIEDERVINVLIIATDESSREFSTVANSDCMIIASVNKKANTLKLVSISRATAVKIPYGSHAGEYDWINTMLKLGGPARLVSTIEEYFNIEIEGYVRVNSKTFIEIVNSCGGIDINLTEREADCINLKLDPESKATAGHIKELGIADQVQTVKPGVNHLNGETATLYARIRLIDNDWARLGRQRNVISSAVNSAKGLSLTEMNTMLNNVLPLIQTNLTKAQITELLLEAPSIAGKSVEQMSLPIEGTYTIFSGLYGKNMYAVDFETNANQLQEFLYG